MRHIAYIPREDADRVPGGDYLHTLGISQRLAPLGVRLDVTAFSDLATHRPPNAVYLSQIYQLDHAERVAQWCNANHVPLLISPLFEDELSLAFGAALLGTGKWHSISRLLGISQTEHLYRFWHTAKRHRYTRWQRQRSILQNAWLLPNSLSELAHLKHWFKLTNSHTHVVPLGIDPVVYDAEASRIDDLPAVLRSLAGAYVLQVGLMSHRKNQIGLLQALIETRHSLVFLGRESPYETRYVEVLRSKALQRGNVTFIDRVDQRTLTALYQHAAVHVMPSWSERPGLVTLEAAACGCRVIATNRSTITDYLGGHVMICNPAESSSIHAAVEHALTSPKEGELRSYVLSQLTWQNSAQYYANALDQILSVSA